MAERWAWWAGGLALALLVALPFLLFLAKMELHLDRLPGEDALPFSIPALAATRLSQLRPPLYEMLYDNVVFVLSGYRTNAAWEQSASFLPMTPAAPILVLFSAFALFRACREAKFAELRTIPLIAMASAAFAFFTVPWQLTRLGWFYIPSLIVSAWYLVELGKRFRFVPILAGAYLAVFLLAFYPYYFVRFNDELTGLDTSLGNGFRIGLEDALSAEMAAAKPGEPVLVDVGTVHPYLYVLFYGFGDIRQFQATRTLKIENGVNRVASFDRFYFEKTALPAGREFVFVSRANALPCGDADILRTDPIWAVGRCPVS
jgi:hypothetical protein